MKTTITCSIFLIIGLTSFAQDCGTGRYLTPVFSSFTTTSNVQYGQNINLQGSNENLLLDVYQPVGDTMAERPLIIWAHGGSFIGGSKTGSDVLPLAKDFAKMGYVTASINYRLGMNGIPFPGPDSVDATETVVRAVHDGRAAIRFFKKDYAENGNTYGIDTNNIFFGGVSAGGVLSVHLAYLDKESEMPVDYIDTSQAGLGGGIEGNSGNPGYRGTAKAIINSAGALRDTAWMEADDTPIISFHGDADGTVPYGSAIIYMSGIFPIMMVDGSASIHERADNLGMNNCFEPWPGQDHTPHVSNAAYYDTLLTMTANFLLQFVCGGPSICSYFSGQCTMTGTVSATDESAIGAGDGSASVSPAGGTAPYTFSWSTGATTASINGLSPGVYQVTVSDQAGCTFTGSTTVNPPGCSMSVSLSGSAESLAGLNDGSATVTITGGTPGYTIMWSTNDSTATINNLAPGSYSVQVTDSSGCFATGSYTVSAGPAVGLPTQVQDDDLPFVYPNPASSVVNFKIKNYRSTGIYIYNAAGIMIMRIDPMGELTKVGTQDLSDWMYFYQVYGQGDRQYGGKFLLVK